MTKVRVGLAGAGWVMGARHLPSFRSHPDVEIAAVYDRRPDRAAALTGAAGLAVPTHEMLDAFLAEGLDIVSIATSPWSHRDIAVAALGAGAHVFTEKPMAMNSREAQEMADAAAAAGRKLCVSHNFLFSRSLRDADRQLAGAPVDYAAGLQLSSDARRLPEWYRDLPGGLMFDEMPHMLYSLNHFLGGGLTLDHARASFDHDRQPRTVELLLRGGAGQGQITMVFCAPVSEWHLALSTKDQLVSLDLFRDIAINIRPDGAHKAKDIARTSATALTGHLTGFFKAGARLVGHRQFWGHEVVIPLFVEAAQGRGPVPVPMEDALNVVHVTDDVLAELDLIGQRQR